MVIQKVDMLLLLLLGTRNLTEAKVDRRMLVIVIANVPDLKQAEGGKDAVQKIRIVRQVRWES